MIIMIALLWIVLCLLILFFRSPKWKGMVGERRVRRVLGRTQEGMQYVINNYTICMEGKSSQIDHILIAQNGVFVIETKNYSGRIYGNASSHTWTQVLKYGKVKNKLYNPLKQNATHLYRLQQLLGNVPMRSVVVFVQNNTQFVEADNVIALRKLRSFLKKGRAVLSSQQMKAIYDQLVTQASNCHVTQRQHIAEIKKMQADIARDICPRCGGSLVLRTGKNGTFYGCEHYPRCKFTKR